MRLRLWDRKKENREPVDERELRLVDRDDGLLDLSFWLRSLAFLARCSPTSSRLGSVQMTSNMVERVAANQLLSTGGDVKETIFPRFSRTGGRWRSLVIEIL